MFRLWPQQRIYYLKRRRKIHLSTIQLGSCRAIYFIYKENGDVIFALTFISEHNYIKQTLNEIKQKMEEKTRAHSTIDNANETWLDYKGAWITYVLLITLGHLFLLSLPFFDTATSWTLTTVIHNVVSRQYFLN